MRSPKNGEYTPSSHLQFLSDSDYGTDLMDSLFLDPEDDDEYDFYRSLETEIKMVIILCCGFFSF